MPKRTTPPKKKPSNETKPNYYQIAGSMAKSASKGIGAVNNLMDDAADKVKAAYNAAKQKATAAKNKVSTNSQNAKAEFKKTPIVKGADIFGQLSGLKKKKK